MKNGRLSPLNSKKRRHDREGWWLIGGSIAVLAGLFIAYVVLTKPFDPKPDANNCSEHIPAKTVVLLDRSEGLPTQTVQEILSRTENYLMNEAEVGEKVSVFSIDDHSSDVLTPLISVCKPAADGNALYQNTKHIRKVFQERFLKPLKAVLATPPKDARTSPIAQALVDLSLSDYLRAPKSTLLIYSDMMENTAKYSTYQCANPVSTIAAFRHSRSGAQERPHFDNTRVQINLIPRLELSQQQLKCRDVLWPWFFGDNATASQSKESTGSPRASLEVNYLPGR